MEQIKKKELCEETEILTATFNTGKLSSEWAIAFQNKEAWRPVATIVSMTYEGKPITWRSPMAAYLRSIFAPEKDCLKYHYKIFLKYCQQNNFKSCLKPNI